MKQFIDVTGLFSNGVSEIVHYDYCVPVDSIVDVVQDRGTFRTVVRYKVNDEIETLAVDEDYATVLDKIRATGSNIS